jgi:hypothetical protein
MPLTHITAAAAGAAKRPCCVICLQHLLLLLLLLLLNDHAVSYAANTLRLLLLLNDHAVSYAANTLRLLNEPAVLYAMTTLCTAGCDERHVGMRWTATSLLELSALQYLTRFEGCRHGTQRHDNCTTRPTASTQRIERISQVSLIAFCRHG